MTPLPHRYAVNAVVLTTGDVDLKSEGLPPLRTAAPIEFDGPGDRWSPETLLVGAVADCIAITFRGVARASKLAWSGFTCEAAGTLDRVDGSTRFTRVDISVGLTLLNEADEDLARRVLDKVKRNCLITNSLNADVHLHATIDARTIEMHGCRS